MPFLEEKGHLSFTPHFTTGGGPYHKSAISRVTPFPVFELRLWTPCRGLQQFGDVLCRRLNPVSGTAQAVHLFTANVQLAAGPAVVNLPHAT